MRDFTNALLLIVVWPVAFGVGFFGCTKKVDTRTDSNPVLVSTESASEIGIALLGGALSAGENAAMANSTQKAIDRMMHFEWFPSAWAGSTQCAFFPLSSGSTSASGVTFSFDSCRFAYSLGEWQGSVSFNFADSAGAVLTGAPSDWASVFTAQDYYHRTYGSGTTRSSENGTRVKLDTANPTGYDLGSGIHQTVALDPIFSKYGTRVKVQNFTDATHFEEEIFMRGLQLTATKTGVGIDGHSFTQTMWNHTVSSDAIHIVSAAGTKTANTDSGDGIYIQHNILRYIAKMSVQNVKWDHRISDGCGCFPVEGKVVSELSGSRSGAETLVFTKQNAPSGFTSTGTCGSATYVSASGEQKNFQLTHCF